MKTPPFLSPNRYSWYTQDSAVVQLGEEICAGITSDQEKVQAVYNYITSNMIYDYMAAMMVAAGQQTGYVPDLDEVLETKMGICFDFAAMMCALLRSQGIPTQMVMGYADAMYHAWNNVYIDGEWVRYDATSAVTFTNISSTRRRRYIDTFQKYARLPQRGGNGPVLLAGGDGA